MWYFALTLIGFCGGGACMFFAFMARVTRVERLRKELLEKTAALDGSEALLIEKRNELNAREQQIVLQQSQFDSQVVTYQHLQSENTILKRDLRNIDVNFRKLYLDRQKQQERQAELDARAQVLGERYLKENVKWISTSLNQNNFAACKQRLLEVVTRCRDIGLSISNAQEGALLLDLKQEFERMVRAAIEREEQARIKAQIREEQLREREAERVLKQLERDRSLIQTALDKALAEANDQHSAEIEALRAKLAEAESKEKAVSQAQLTKAGHIYVISNVGAFGEGVFKIGMTRRLNPHDRVKELGDASVPFPFDVHMMVSADDAPSLENTLHRTFHKNRLNKTNPRKEFFRAGIHEIAEIVKTHRGEIQYVADAEALEYRQSLTMSDDDQEYIEEVFDKFEDDGDDPDAAGER